MISSHTLPGKWLFIHTGIKVHVSENDPWTETVNEKHNTH